jgi:hypothetical protein
MPVSFNPSYNPATGKKYLKEELIQLCQEQDQKISRLESATSLEYSWSRICKEAQGLIQKQIAEETRTIWKDAKTIYSSLSFELINHPTSK